MELSRIDQNLTSEERLDAAKALGQKFSDERNASFEAVLAIVGSHDPLHLLSVLSTYGLTKQSGADSVIHPNLNNCINQSHVELVQALTLHVADNETPRPPAPTRVIQDLWNHLVVLGRAFDMSALGKRIGDETDALFIMQQRMRMSTRGVRNWGYYSQVLSISRALLEPLDEYFKRTLGFHGSCLVALGNYMIRTIEDRVNARRSYIFEVLRKDSLEELARAFQAAFPDTEPTDLLTVLTDRGFELESARNMLLSYSDLSLSDCFAFSIAELAVALKEPEEEVAALLEAISQSPGALNSRDPHMFFLDNPVWLAPAIRLEDGTFFCCMPQVLLSFVFEIIESLVRPYDDLAIRWQSRRSEYLEEEIEKVFTHTLPGALVWRGVKWSLSGDSTQWETDLLVVFDSILLVVEAKSGAVSASAKRGAPDRLRREVRDLLETPSLQSQRFVDALEAQLHGGATLTISHGVNLSAVKYVLRLSVTLENFCAIQSNLGALQAIGLIAKEVRPAPTLCLADLHTVCHILDRPSLFLHYLHRRMHLEGHFNHIADELNLLGCYLENGLLFGDAETDQRPIFFHRMLMKVHRYMMSRDEGTVLAKPTKKFTPWWVAMIELLEERQFPRWTEAVIALLDVDNRAQKELKANLKRLVRRHRFDNGRRPYQNAMIYIHGGLALTAAVVVVTTKTNDERRCDIASNVMASAFKDPRPSRCVLIGVNADAPQHPYNFLMVSDRWGERDSQEGP
jgi:hypothetical protein